MCYNSRGVGIVNGFLRKLASCQKKETGFKNGIKLEGSVIDEIVKCNTIGLCYIMEKALRHAGLSK
jgi:hypothetical protein